MCIYSSFTAFFAIPLPKWSSLYVYAPSCSPVCQKLQKLVQKLLSLGGAGETSLLDSCK